MKNLKDFIQFFRVAWSRNTRFPHVSEWFQIRFDDAVINLQVSSPKKEPWAAEIKWESIIQVCFSAGDLYKPDIIYIFTDERPESYTIPSAADTKGALWDEIVRRGLFDADLASQAMASTNRLFCDPPIE